MKSKITLLKYTGIAAPLILLLLAMPSVVMAQKALPSLNPKMEAYAKPQSTRDWISFKEETTINPVTIFTDLKAAFDLSERDQMKLNKTEKDNLGFTHYRYQQYYNNYKVTYGEYSVHQLSDGFVQSANGHLVTGLQAGSIVSIGEQQALTNALQFMHASKYLWQNSDMEKELKRIEKNDKATYYPIGELVYAPSKNADMLSAADYRLTWHFKIYTDDTKVIAKSVYVDAVTGQVIHHIDIAMNCTGGSGGSAFNGSVSFSTELSGGSYRSHNDCQATNIRVYNCAGAGAATNYYTDADNAWTLTSQQSAVQCQWGALMTYNYYIGQHSRASWDNAAGDLIAYNNANAGQNNACWGCTGNQAIFYAGSTSAATDDWNTDDIVGHEFTHGVTQASAGLVYSYESGALNESFSDIFGEMVESWSEGTCDYLVGADRGAIRSFINPSDYSDYGGTMPDTYLGTGWYSGSSDNGGVHHNSSVQNHWFYLLSEGGSGTNDFGIAYNVTGITRFKARLIAYRALTVYLTTSSKYIDARAASIQAAYDLYGGCSAEVIAVGDAWHAVGVESQSGQFIINACGTYSSGEFVQAISQLTAANGCPTLVNSTTSAVVFTARDRVILYPGFTATSGSKFVGYIEPCSSSRYRTQAPQDTKSDPEKGIKPPPVYAKVPELPVASIADGIAISPNPFHSAFDLSISSAHDNQAQVTIFSSLGVKVKEKQNISLIKGFNKTTFNCSNLANGTYMVEIVMGDKKIVKKVVKM